MSSHCDRTSAALPFRRGGAGNVRIRSLVGRSTVPVTGGFYEEVGVTWVHLSLPWAGMWRGDLRMLFRPALL